jgi:nucleotide-binding universal stress UspA family protein
MTNPIVVGTDGSPSAERAVEWAAAEAARRRCRLHVVYAAQPRECGLAFSPGPWDVELLTEAGEHFLLHATEIAAKAIPDVPVTTELMFEAPGFALREQAARAAEVVVGHRGRGGFAGLLLGSTSLSLAGRTPCPLVIVRGGSGEGDEVLAGVDLRDEESARVLEYAFEAAAVRGAWVRAVYTWTLFDGANPGAVREALTAAQTHLSEAVAPWRARYPEVRVVEETPPGHPVEELVCRSDRADLLVVGSHRHGAGPHIGSVSHGVIHHADCPVVVIDPPKEDRERR